MSKKTSNNSRKKPAPPITFRGVVPAVDKFLKLLEQRSPEYAVLKFLRNNAVSPRNATCWREIQLHLRECGHGDYKKRTFQMTFLQFCRKSYCFIAAYHKEYYLPRKPEDFIPYLIYTANRIKVEQAHLKSARTLQRHQQEEETTRQSRQPRTRATAKRKSPERPTTNRTPRKARSKGRRTTRS